MHLDASLSSLKTEMLKRHVILNIVCAVGCVAEVMRAICKQGGVEHDPPLHVYIGQKSQEPNTGIAVLQ